MLSSFSAALEKALAPSVPPVVDFRHHWNSFLRYYAENKPLGHKTRPIETTDLIHHLNKMLKLLIDEQAEVEQNSLGPCTEFLIHHQVLDILSSLAQADTPPGIRPYIVKLFAFVVNKIEQKGSIVLLPYVNVYFPMRRLLMLSAVSKASPTETEELEFVCGLVMRLKAHPEFVSLFAHESKPGDCSHSSSRRSSFASSSADGVDVGRIREMIRSDLKRENEEKSFEQFESQHLVVSALINFVESADYLVSIKAMETLLTVCGLPDEAAAENAIVGTPLCEFVSGRLSNLYRAIPSPTGNDESLCLDVGFIEEISVNWIEAHHLHGLQSDLQDFPGKSELVAFFSWLDYSDNLIKEAIPQISDALAVSLREDFFETWLEPKLIYSKRRNSRETEGNQGTNWAEVISSLAIMSQCWTHIRSEKLAEQFCVWLFGNPEEAEEEIQGGALGHDLKIRLIELCSSKKSIPSEVTLETLSFFDVLLDRPHGLALESLCLNGLEGRGYYNDTLAESAISSWSDEEDEREKSRDPEENVEELTEVTKTTTSDRRSKSLSPQRTLNFRSSKTMAPSNIARVINSWLYLVPAELRGDNNAAKDSGYEQYVKNAQKYVAETFEKCSGYSLNVWPREALTSSQHLHPHQQLLLDSASSDSRAEADPSRQFYEGHFLSSLLDSVSNLPDQEYDVNLQLTSLLAKLSQIPHPYLHEYLLNPTIPLAPGVRSLYTCLKSVVTRISEETKNVEQLQRKVYLCRKTLLNSRANRLALNLTPRETKLIDGLIVLEEFSKEIAAIALVKYHLTS